MHGQHKYINKSNLWMGEGTGQGADDFEAEAPPKTHGPLVCAHDEIELHGPKPPGSGPFERMRTHDAGNPSPRGLGGGHVSAFGDMTAPAELVRA